MTHEEEKTGAADSPDQPMEPITHGGTDARYKLCRCSRCEMEAECTPWCDFYTREGDPQGPLFCGGCLLTVSLGGAL